MQDAVPIRFDAVQGKKDVYNLYNMWGDSEYQHYLGQDSSHTGATPTTTQTSTLLLAPQIMSLYNIKLSQPSACLLSKSCVSDD